MRQPKGGQFLQQAVFLGPSLVVFSIILIAPFVLGIYYSFTDWNGLTAHPNWVGWDNWIRVLTDDPYFGKAFLFTLKYSVVNVLLINVGGLLLALLLTGKLKGTSLYRTAFFVPNVIGGLLLGFIFQFIFVKGFSSLGELTGMWPFTLPWLGTPTTAFWAIISIGVWQSAGYMMMIYIAGILSIPSELVEAATIDGAGKLRTFRSITLPLLMPAITICMFLTISHSFKAYDQILSLTGGGPFRSTVVVTMDIYDEAFGRNNMGYGSAKAVIFFLIIAVITLAQVWTTKRKEVEA